MQLAKLIKQIFVNTNTKQKGEMKLLKEFKGASVFDTFMHVDDYFKMKKLYKKMNKGYKKSALVEEREMLKSSIMLSPNERLKAIAKAEQSMYDAGVKRRLEKGKKVGFLTRKRAESKNFRNTEKFVSQNLLRAGIGCAINYNDIAEAKEKLGTGAMCEEILKTSLMFSVGFGSLKACNNFAKTAGKTATVYMVKGERLLTAGITAVGIAGTISVKPVMDSLWTTEYEKQMSIEILS